MRLRLKTLMMLIWLTMTVCVWYSYKHGTKNEEIQEKVIEMHNYQWTKQEGNISSYRSELNRNCHGKSQAIVTQQNTPMGTLIAYDGNRHRAIKVTQDLYKTFSKEQPFKNVIWDTCAVVGNGGILVDSNCGEEIDSAEFVIRCNLPILDDRYQKDVGNKTDLVTANPSILYHKFQGLTERRYPFVEKMSAYGDSFLLLPAFSYTGNTPASLRAFYTLKEFGSAIRVGFFNPRYLSNLARFWKARGVAGPRLSTGFIMTSIALELCSSVRLYGFWPFPVHPYGCHQLTNHYYDDLKGSKMHNMDLEFKHLLHLHEKGVTGLYSQTNGRLSGAGDKAQATFLREWRLKEHENTHTGARPLQCLEKGCGRRFSKTSHLTRHKLGHHGEKKIQRHVRYVHGDKSKYFKCQFQECSLTFRKRKALKTHLATHGIASHFKCTKEGCGAKFETSAARRAHEKTHAGYPCPQSGCQVVAHTWGKLQRHLLEHPAAVHTCKECQKEFKKRAALQRHKRTHAMQRPVLMCPSDGCQAYFTTTFNLQHHIRKVHLQLLKYRCYFPDCTRTFAMQESLHRHILRHGPDEARVQQLKRHRAKKNWQKRLERRHQAPLVEDDLRRLFTQKMRFSRRGKLEADLSCLFNERKIPRHIDPEVNLSNLFSLKPPRPTQPNAQGPLCPSVKA
ncbi:hypothetical protein GJAV_G00262010 [Gymnothorax javanicus]|nr:hypothetical protein GJAV_G00262010 [Gymnothorax javanicus]